MNPHFEKALSLIPHSKVDVADDALVYKVAPGMSTECTTNVNKLLFWAKLPLIAIDTVLPVKDSFRIEMKK